MTRGAGTGATAHRREVKDLAVSKDVSLLLSASADCTLAVWAIDTDRQMTTMTGHRDEVCAAAYRTILCSGISYIRSRLKNRPCWRHSERKKFSGSKM